MRGQGRFSYRPGTWLSVVDLEGLEPVAGDERYLVFLRNWAGGRLAGRPGPGRTGPPRSGRGRAPAADDLRGGGDQAVDDATSIPHGQPVLQWFDASLGPPRARPFDFAKGTEAARSGLLRRNKPATAAQTRLLASPTARPTKEAPPDRLPRRRPQPDQGQRGPDRRSALRRPARPDAALLGPGPRADRGGASTRASASTAPRSGGSRRSRSRT